LITAEDIERAENVLSVIYGEDLPRQLEHLQVQGEAVDAVCVHCWQVIERAYADSFRNMDPRLQAAINTMLVHMFLVGLIAGRHSMKEIE
jgi:hypothetical protein